MAKILKNKNTNWKVSCSQSSKDSWNCDRYYLYWFLSSSLISPSDWKPSNRELCVEASIIPHQSWAVWAWYFGPDPFQLHVALERGGW